jgi:hypothetical protein
VPDPDVSRRSNSTEYVLTSDEGTVGEFRLAVASSLPVEHMRYLTLRIRELCANWLRQRRIPENDVSVDELVSEVWLKLVSTLSPIDENSTYLSGRMTESTDPTNDSRVMFLIAEIGGSQALAHRYADIRRERYDRDGRLRQPEDEAEDVVDEERRDEASSLRDVSRIWRGVLIFARRTFRPLDDVSLLLGLLVATPEVLEDGQGRQWPISRIVELLNGRPPPRRWNDAKVDNAKRRLMNWIQRLRHVNGMDITDLEALFARVARQAEAGDRDRPPRIAPNNLTN